MVFMVIVPSVGSLRHLFFFPSSVHIITSSRSYADQLFKKFMLLSICLIMFSKFSKLFCYNLQCQFLSVLSHISTMYVSNYMISYLFQHLSRGSLLTCLVYELRATLRLFPNWLEQGNSILMLRLRMFDMFISR